MKGSKCGGRATGAGLWPDSRVAARLGGGTVTREADEVNVAHVRMIRVEVAGHNYIAG